MKMEGQVCFDLRRSLPAAEVNGLATGGRDRLRNRPAECATFSRFIQLNALDHTEFCAKQGEKLPY